MAGIEFSSMLLKNAESLKPFAGSLTHDTEDAKDLLQETLYRALANKEKYHAGTNIKAWLFTIMRNVFINNYRRKTKQHTVMDSSSNDYLVNSAKTASLNDALSKLNIKEIQEAIFRLPAIFKIPFLFYFDGYRYNEIAEILGEPLGTVKSRIHFARKLLKTQTNRF